MVSFLCRDASSARWGQHCQARLDAHHCLAQREWRSRASSQAESMIFVTNYTATTARECALRSEQKVVRASEQKEQPLRVTFMGIDAFWSLFGALSRLPMRGAAILE